MKYVLNVKTSLSAVWLSPIQVVHRQVDPLVVPRKQHFRVCPQLTPAAALRVYGRSPVFYVLKGCICAFFFGRKIVE